MITVRNELVKLTIEKTYKSLLKVNKLTHILKKLTYKNNQYTMKLEYVTQTIGK